ncbi:hypothetical protein [Paenibacillus macerans]|uniref:hypothetical protein n=1 Tax=Paenibacillus macerans TaxID=44252 RepID=UPI003D312F8F
MKLNPNPAAKPVTNAKRAFMIARDMSWLQLIWSAWFISFVILFYALIEIDAQNFLPFAYQPSKVFMLVIGILSVSGFLTFFVKQGVTRKAYFYGSSLAAAAVALVLMGFVGVLGSLQQLLFPVAQTRNFLGENFSWPLTVLVYSLNILVYYVAGYLIGAGFYRFGKIGGMLYIVLALAVILISDVMWEFELKETIQRVVYLGDILDFPVWGSLTGTLLLVGVTLWIIRATTKRVRIKLK